MARITFWYDFKNFMITKLTSPCPKGRGLIWADHRFGGTSLSIHYQADLQPITPIP